MDLANMNPLMKMIIKKVWELAIHPQLLKLEDQIPEEHLKTIVEAVDKAIDDLIEAEL